MLFVFISTTVLVVVTVKMVITKSAVVVEDTTSKDISLKYPSIPPCRGYHPFSELINQPGYYPNINDEQLSAANELILLIEKENLSFNCDEEHEFLKLLRFLRARKFNVKNAFKMIESDIKWREEENRISLRQETADEVLKCNITEFYRYFPAWMQGHDK